MKITRLVIHNFQSIDTMTIEDIENTLILVGKNNVGKSSVLNAFKLLCGFTKATLGDFYKKNEPIEIQASLRIYENEINNLYQKRKVSEHRKFEKWYEEFKQKLPSFDGQKLSFGMKVYPNGEYRYYDGIHRNNPYIQEVLPSVSLVSESRNIDFLNNKLIDIHGFEGIREVMENTCIFDLSRKCSNCFDCIGFINKKAPIDLTLQETFKLVNYRLYSTNLKKYADSINRFFQKTYGNTSLEISYQFNFDMESLLKVHTMVKNANLDTLIPISEATTSMRSLYILSLFQAYIDIEGAMEDLILIELPELHLHPEMQKITSEILYHLSKKNQVIYTTHSPYMLYNFNNRQIQQITVSPETHDTILGPALDLDDILDDLGYSANDMIGADFVFIVEGKDDRSRLPLLLENYYREVHSEDGEIHRMAIIPTNSCTNIKTYANLKFINKSYLKDNFLMIRDSDGKDRDVLVHDLCRYYDDRIRYDDAKIPRIAPKNVLVLRYYSIENYFLNPSIMVRLGIIQSEEEFYQKIFDKFEQYLGKIKSGLNFYKKTQIEIKSVEDVKKHIEEIKIYIRGHNLFDIFYGRYKPKAKQLDLLKEYIRLAPREEFRDLLDGIDRFIYFENRRKSNVEGEK